MKRSLWLSTSLLLACGGKSEPAPATAPTAPTTAPTATVAPATAAPEADAAAPATVATETAAAPDASAAPATGSCLPPDLFQSLKDLDPDFAAIEGDGITLCGETASETSWCFTLDLGEGTIQGGKRGDDDLSHVANGVTAINDPFRRKEDEPVLRLCLNVTTGCKDVYVGQTLAAFLSEDRKQAAVTTLDEREKRVRVFDTTTLAELGNVLVEKDIDLPDCTFGALVSGVLLISSGPCGPGPEGHRAWLADPTTGAKTADIGAMPNFDLRYAGFAHVKDDLWAFRDGDGMRIVVQNVKSGAVQATIDLAAAAGPTKAIPSWLFVRPDPFELIAVENRPLGGATYAFDPMTGKPTRALVPKVCPQ